MRNISKRKPIIISLFLVLAILIGLSSIYFKNVIETSKQLPVHQFEQSNINNADIGEYISSNHDYWNDELCWGRSKNFSFIVFQKHYDKYIEDLNEIINAVDDPNLKADFIHVRDLLENANETNDITYLIDVHRIFHDLDVKYNKYATRDYFGITQYGENH